MRKLLKSISMIGITTAIALSATMAYFSDTETSTGNKISAGELDLLIADNSENFRNGVTATWMAENMQPGDERAFAVEKIELIKNLGSIEASHTEITCDYSVIEEIPCFESDTDCHTDDHPDEMAEEMIITKCVFHDGFCIDCLTGNKWDGYDPINGVCANNDLSPDPVEQSDRFIIPCGPKVVCQVVQRFQVVRVLGIDQNSFENHTVISSGILFSRSARTFIK